LGAAAWERFSSVCDYVEALHPKEVPEPHWYLPLLGVDPRLQRQGAGSALLKVILDRADKDALPAYLWTAKSRNVPFYQRHGFEVSTEGEEPGSGIWFWTMKRPGRQDGPKR
jgi:GNAT superfamily N-acetyltransferase